ncbi:MAG: hypothetical protein IT384_10440 [Deltaproteobacteria bacterium]|nr:hypothetical protein [Deltaproteobacteria bacterium]
MEKQTTVIALPRSVLELDRDVVFEFFVFFSRFEYALKRRGFFDGDEKGVAANWDQFANSVRGKFRDLDQTAFVAACSYLKMHPPKKQVLHQRALSWKETQPGTGESDEAFITRCVRTVRNNLFHGGKYPVPDGPVSEVARDHQLLQHCVAVLDACLALDPDLKRYFQETE